MLLGCCLSWTRGLVGVCRIVTAGLRAQASVVAMEHGTHARPTGRWWRIGTPVVFALGGVLFAVSAANSEGTDLRPTRYTDLASFVEHEADEANRLTARFAELSSEVEALSAGLDDRSVNRYNSRIDTMLDPAGLTPRSGPGVTVSLSDAPQEVIEESDLDPNKLVVHQQNIQAVANAMWRGGAEAITIQGQRIVSTTGIKCAGSTVQLQGVPYAPPYVITAVGDPAEILYSLERDASVRKYRDRASNPLIGVGFEMAVEEFVTAPAFEGLLDLSYAVPVDG